jgi:hypothetical protein
MKPRSPDALRCNSRKKLKKSVARCSFVAAVGSRLNALELDFNKVHSLSRDYNYSYVFII